LTIDRLNGVMEVLRRQIAESARRMDVQGKSSRDPSATLGAASSKPPLPEVKRRIQERLGALSKNDPDRNRKAQRLFIESVLTWEFGDALLLDKRFEEMLDRVQEGLAAAPEVIQQFDRFLASLEQNDGAAR
jgi:hypothetical protein